MCCLGGLSGVVKVCTIRTTACEAIGGLRVEVLKGYLSKNQTTGEVKIREVTFELLREVGFRRGQLLSQDSRDFP